jgi:hypothetical protein
MRPSKPQHTKYMTINTEHVVVFDPEEGTAVFRSAVTGHQIIQRLVTKHFNIEQNIPVRT